MYETVQLFNDNDSSLFIANWSISEMPLKLRKKILKYIFNVNYILISFQDKFENINKLIGSFEKEGNPIVSIDSKKKEVLVFRNRKIIKIKAKTY